MDAATLQAVEDLGAGRFAKLSCDERAAASHARQTQESNEPGNLTRDAKHPAWNDASRFEADPRVSNLADNDDYTGQTHRARLLGNMQYARNGSSSSAFKQSFAARSRSGQGFGRDPVPDRSSRAAAARPRHVQRAPSPRAAGTVKFMRGKRVDQDAAKEIFNQLLASAPRRSTVKPPPVVEHAVATPWNEPPNATAAPSDKRSGTLAPSDEGKHFAKTATSQVRDEDSRSCSSTATVKPFASRAFTSTAAMKSIHSPANTESPGLSCKPAKSSLQASGGSSKQYKGKEIRTPDASPMALREDSSQQPLQDLAQVNRIVELVAKADDEKALREYVNEHPTCHSIVPTVQEAFARIRKTDRIIFQALKSTLSSTDRQIYLAVEEYFETSGAVKRASEIDAAHAHVGLVKSLASVTDEETQLASRAAIALLPPQPKRRNGRSQSNAGSNYDSANEAIHSKKPATFGSLRGSRWAPPCTGKPGTTGNMRISLQSANSSKVEECRYNLATPYNVEMTITPLKQGTEPRLTAELMKTLAEEFLLRITTQAADDENTKQSGHNGSENSPHCKVDPSRSRTMPGSYVDTTDEEDIELLSDGEWNKEQANIYVQDMY